jgi:hypothetical protein
MLDLLCKKLLYSTSYVNLLSILHHLLLASSKKCELKKQEELLIINFI